MYKIILVDDEPNALELLSSVFDWNELGFELSGKFEDGEDALEFIKSNSIDAMITDIKMPRMNGMELIENAIGIYPDLKVAIISAYKDFEYAKMAMKYGVKEFVVKPVVFEELKSCVLSLKKELDSTVVNQKSESEIVENQDTDKIILKAISYINAHLNKNISLQEISSYVGLNKNYFCAYFKKHTGDSFINFVTKLKIEHVKNILRTDDVKISALSEMIGYKNQTHFYNLFKSYTGMTPLQYHNNYIDFKNKKRK